MLPDARHRRSTMIDVRLPVGDPAIPADVERFLYEANQRIVQFQQSAHIPGFVPSDYHRVYGVLHAITSMELDPDDFDVVFAYPWPDEDQMTADLFQRFAAPGAVLVTFHGGDDLRIRRKSVSTSRRRSK